MDTLPQPLLRALLAELEYQKKQIDELIRLVQRELSVTLAARSVPRSHHCSSRRRVRDVPHAQTGMAAQRTEPGRLDTPA